MAYSLRELRRDLSRGNTALQRRIAGWRWRRANRAATAASDPAPGDLRVVFAIPLIGRARAADWSVVERNLAATLGALLRQEDPRWIAFICGQDRPALPDDPRIRFLPFTRKVEGIDKGAKYATLRRATLTEGPPAGYFYILDADDLVHPGLVGHILRDDNRQGYLVSRGYMLDHARMALAVLQPADVAYPEATEFHRSCGSSSALWFDAASGADFATVLAARGNHRKVVRNMGYLGFRMDELPFHAAIYVMNHGENLREKRGLMDGKMKHFDINPVRDPAERARIGATFGLNALFPGRWPEPAPPDPPAPPPG